MYGSAGKVAGRISAWAVPERNLLFYMFMLIQIKDATGQFQSLCEAVEVVLEGWCGVSGVPIPQWWRGCMFSSCSAWFLFQMHPEAGNFGLLDALQVVSAFCSLQSS